MFASLIDGEVVVGGVTSEKHSLCRELEFDIAVFKTRGCSSRDTSKTGQDVAEVSF